MKNFTFTRTPLSNALTRNRLLPSLVFSSLTLLAAPHAGAVVMDLGTIPDATAVKANAISGDGRVVVGRWDDASTYRPFRWSAAQGFGTLGNFTKLAEATAVSRDGGAIAGTANFLGGNSYAFFWNSSNGGKYLATLGGTSSGGTGISDNGSVVVGWADTATSRHAFRWEANTMQDLGTLAGTTTSRANGVSGDGAVVVGNSGNKAFRWDATNKMVDLGNLGRALSSTAAATNQDGAVVVGASSLADGTQHAFRWVESSGMQDLGTFGGDLSYAQDVSADGSVVVGGAELANGIAHAFRWTTATGITDLGTLTGEDRSWATSVSDDGNTIVGNSGTRAFIWRSNAGIQDLSNLQDSVIKSATTVGYLTAAQNRRIRDLNQPQCIPGATQQYCLSVGAVGYRGEGESSGTQKIGQATAGLRINDEYAVGANANLATADLNTQGAKQDSAFGLSLWTTYQQNPDNLGWNGTASVAMGQSDNSFERGTGLADVQRARATSNMSSTGLRAAVGYGVKVDTTVVTPEIAISHVTTERDGFTERNAAFPLTIKGSTSTDTYATFGVRTATPLSPKATLHLGAAIDVLLGKGDDTLEGSSQVPGLSNFKLDSSADKRTVVPVAMAGYSYALDANQSLGAQVQVGAGAYDQQKTLFGVGVQYKYAF